MFGNLHFRVREKFESASPLLLGRDGRAWVPACTAQTIPSDHPVNVLLLLLLLLCSLAGIVPVILHFSSTQQ